TGAVTTNETATFKTYIQALTMPTSTGYGNDFADGTSGLNCHAIGQEYQITKDSAVLDVMIKYSDAFLSQRNDFTDRRVMWTGKVEPVWLTKPSTNSEAGYAGCENGEIAGHIAFCAKLI